AHKDGEITNMSGHSQAGPPVAKVAAKHNVERVTNFSDWGAGTAYAYGYITKEDKEYLDKHAYIYSDSENNTTKYAADGGNIPYGHVREIEGSSHSAQYARIKGNNVDTDYYVKHHQFCSGMTKEQVEEVAKYKASHDHNPFKDKEDYMKEYKEDYGSYAKSKKSKGKKKKASSTGSKKILLKKPSLLSLTKQMAASVKEFENKVNHEMDETKEQVHTIIERARAQAYELAEHLSSGEVEALLADIEFSACWSQGVEEADRSQARQFSQQLEKLGDDLEAAGNQIEGADNESASQFGLV
ncbi:hypothetical protein ACFOSE_09660, partial [Streptococcus dentapri]